MQLHVIAIHLQTRLNKKMALEIKSIPVLKNDAAEAFIKKAEANMSKRATVDFSKQVISGRAILKKAKI